MDDASLTPLTPLEQRIYSFIRGVILREDHSPTMTEIGRAVGIASKGTVHRYTQSLIEKGYLQSTGQGWRGIRLTSTPSTLTTLPLVGRIAAGRPIEAIQNHDEVNVYEMLLGVNRFALRVQGDSMCEAGILDGDTVIVEQRVVASTGDIVVALIDEDEATLKYFKKLPQGKIELIPANAALCPITYDAARIRIQGVVVGQMRQYP